MAKKLSEDEVRKVARLARLALSDAQVEIERERLGAVLGYVDRFGELDLEGVEPMPHVGGGVNVFDDDVVGEILVNEVLMEMAPEVHEPFVKVPRVLDDGREGGGA